MARSNLIKVRFDAGTIVWEDGSDPVLSHTVRFDGADFSASGLKPGQRESVVIQGRGKLRSVRRGQRTFPQISFTIEVAEFSEASAGTFLDFLYGKAGTPYAARVSQDTTSMDVSNFKCTLTIEGTDIGDDNDHQLIFNKVEVTEASYTQGEPDTISVTGTVYGDIGGDIVDSGLDA
jgi:hypothetical protein